MADNSQEKYPYHIRVDLAGIPVCIQLQYAEAYRYFGSFSSETPNSNHVLLNATSPADTVTCKGVSLSEHDWTLLKKHGFTRCGQVEASYLASYCSDRLLRYDRCIIHAAAFRDRERAWVIAADPGVGKSTQVRTLQELYPGAFSVICGDRPVLELTDADTVMVHPSPWNGKEFWGGAGAAPLAGIILLRRGEEDSVTLMGKKESVLPVYRSLIHSATTEGIVRMSAAFADVLLQRVPVWSFVNRDIPGSTRLLYQKVLKERSE